MEEQIIDAWQIHNRINIYLLDAISEAALEAVSASKGRNVANQFAHIHNVRSMWLKSASPDLLDGLSKIETEEQIDNGNGASDRKAIGRQKAKCKRQK